LNNQAGDVLKNECKNIKVSPDNLRPKDGTTLILGLMTSVGEYLNGDEWSLVDTQIKKLLNKYENKPVPGKVKGNVFCAIIEYITLKGGERSLSMIKNEPEILKDPWEESWYPISLLTNLLTAVETYMGIKKGLRCREVGNHVISHLSFLFEDDSHTTSYSLQRLNELFQLKGLSFISITPSTIILEFDGNMADPIVDLIIGLCEGILAVRKAEADLLTNKGNSHDPNNILISLNGKEDITC
jgi:hypothetical protein